MKKYLITAMAVAVSGILTSCHEDELSGSIVEMKKEAFEETFVKAFGQPDPNHTWGFRTSDATALTRGTINVNGNMWDTCPTVEDPAEVTAIYDYVKYTLTKMTELGHKYSTTAPQNINGYFVTQVRDGKNADNIYPPFSGSDVTAGEKMNHLQIAMTSSATFAGLSSAAKYYPYEATGWKHINNFNASSNVNYGGNTKVENAGAYDFAYHNSLDSKYHNKWILIDGADITADKKYANYYYVCFDYESAADGTKTNMKFKIPLSNGDWQEKMGSIDGAWTYADAVAQNKTVTVEGITYTIGQTGTKDWDFYQVQEGDKWIPGNNIYTDWIVRITKGAPSGGGGSTTTGPQVYEMSETSYNNGSVKRQVITGERVVESGRVFCEDLGSSSLNDIDYNDIVFDAVIVNEYEKLVTTYYDASDNVERTETSYSFDAVDGHTGYDRHYALIRLMAAGGTIPAAVKGYEVHDELGGNGTTVMINTLDEDSRTVVGMAAVATATPSDLKDVDTQSTKFYGINNINDITIDVRYSQVSEKLTAKHGAVPSKILVPLGTRWPRERQNIGEAYPEFGDYVKNANHNFWTGQTVESKLYDNLQGLTVQEGDMITEEAEVYSDTEDNSGTQTSKTLVDATNSTMLTPATGETILYNYTTAGPGYLYGETDGDNSIGRVTVASTGVTVGCTVRVYGVSIADWELSSNFATQKTSYTADGYVDFVIDQQTAGIINGDLSFTGKHFTITYVTVIAGSQSSSNQIWPASGTGAESKIFISDTKLFTNLTSSNKICLYCSASGYWIQFYFGNWPVLTTIDGFNAPDGWAIDNNDHKTIQYNGSYNGKIEIQLDNVMVGLIKQQGFGIQGDYTITKITIE